MQEGEHSQRSPLVSRSGVDPSSLMERFGGQTGPTASHVIITIRASPQPNQAYSPAGLPASLSVNSTRPTFPAGPRSVSSSSRSAGTYPTTALESSNPHSLLDHDGRPQPSQVVRTHRLIVEPHPVVHAGQQLQSGGHYQPLGPTLSPGRVPGAYSTSYLAMGGYWMRSLSGGVGGRCG